MNVRMLVYLYSWQGGDFVFLHFYLEKEVVPMSWLSGDYAFWKQFLRLWRTPAHMAQMRPVCTNTVNTA